MKAFLDRLHTRVGDLWWYSAMLFIACRSGDVIQAFIGLWLVPKYVGPQELGAVLPLQQLSSFFTVPLAIVAVVFSKYVNTYATRGELGKVKSFIHDVIIVSAALMLVCIAAAYWLIPHFYSRLNIATGSLTVLVLASGFVGNISNLFGSALQGLKKFKTMTVQSLISAPIRLITLLVAMPFRPLSGYLLGQTTPSASSGLLAALSIRKDLKNVARDPSWRKDLPNIWRYLWPLSVYTTFGALFSTISATIYRQRLPEIESSAYYMLSRFAETAGYVGSTLSVVLIPLASEAHEKNNEKPAILLKAIAASILISITIAIAFHFGGDALLSLNKTWRSYQSFAYLLPLMTITVGLGATIGSILSYEMACRRFTLSWCILLFNLAWTIFLVSFTGYEFFRGMLPNSIVNWMASIHLGKLSTITWAGLCAALMQIILICIVRSKTFYQWRQKNNSNL